MVPRQVAVVTSISAVLQRTPAVDSHVTWTHVHAEVISSSDGLQSCHCLGYGGRHPAAVHRDNNAGFITPHRQTAKCTPAETLQKAVFPAKRENVRCTLRTVLREQWRTRRGSSVGSYPRIHCSMR